MGLQTNFVAAISILAFGCGQADVEEHRFESPDVEEHRFESPDVDACEHFNNGPFEDLEAGSTTDVATRLPKTHTVYRTLLTGYADPDASFGFVSYENKRQGVVNVYTRGVNVQNGPESEDASCDSGVRVTRFELSVGEHTFHLDTDGPRDVSILIIPANPTD